MGLQLLAGVMDRWSSFSRFGSSKLPRNHPHVAVFILILQVTYMRPSELLTLRKKAHEHPAFLERSWLEPCTSEADTLSTVA